MSAARATQDGSVNDRDDRIVDGGQRHKITRSVLLPVFFLHYYQPLVVQLEQSFPYVCVFLSVWTITFELSDL